MSKQEIMNIDLSPVLRGYYARRLGKNPYPYNFLLNYLNALGSLQYKHFYSFQNSTIKLNKEMFDKSGFKSACLKLDKNNKNYLSTVVAPIPINFVKKLKDNRLGELIVYSL